MKTLESRISKAIDLGCKYIERVKMTVPKKYHTFNNTCLPYVVWTKFLSRGKISVSKTEYVEIGFFKYLYLYFKLK